VDEDLGGLKEQKQIKEVFEKEPERNQWENAPAKVQSMAL